LTNPPDPQLLARLRARWAAAPTCNLIDGQWHDAVSGETFHTLDPSTGGLLARAAASDARDVERAVAAARAAFEGPWSRVKPSERTNLLLKLAELIEANGDELALTETLDVGRPIALSRMIDVGGAVGQLRYHAGWASKLAGETNELSAPGEWLAYSLREPVGVVAQIVPWNFPLVMAVAKLAPAIAAGCTVVLKPAEQTPLSTVRLGELVCEAGFPDGVVNIVTGFGRTAGAALAAHPDVDKVAFTGSTQTGRAIVDAAKGNFKRVALELGGKSPTFIFADADLERAIPAAAMGIFSNAGQVCAAGSRLFVHEQVADQVLEGVARIAGALRIGSSLSPDTQIGPIISASQLDRVLGYIESGREEGAKVLAGGARIGSEGWFVQPTMLVDVNPRMKVVREEVFGPVLSAMRFGDDDDVDSLARAGNDSDYGLAAAIHTSDISKAHRLARRLRAGTVRVNGAGGVDPAVPLGGYKASGWGRENGRAGVEAYTETKTVTVAL
jgi:phenylacetaldehyde dehydrogenase